MFGPGLHAGFRIITLFVSTSMLFSLLTTCIIKGTVSRNGSSLTAVGVTVAESSNNKATVFAFALVQYYDFLPPFNITSMRDQILDAVVWSPSSIALSPEMVTTFMNVEGEASTATYKQIVPAIFICKNIIYRSYYACMIQFRWQLGI